MMIHHVIWYHITAAAAAAAAAAAFVRDGDVIFFFGNFTLKKWPSKIHENAKKIRKKILYIFIVESLQDDMVSFKLWSILLW